jgi:hypothetical protein
LFGFGSNEYGALGIDNVDYISKMPQINFFNDKNILDFICGYKNSYVLIG